MEFEEFEWDDDKNAENIKKHGIDFKTAMQAFDDDRAIPFADPDHSTVGEPRYALLGMCEAGLVFISFTYRGEKSRIITVRKASKRMQRMYAEND
jgi:uncharacterized DUF497 family protein